MALTHRTYQRERTYSRAPYFAPVTPTLKTLPTLSFFLLKAWPKMASYCLSMVFILRIAASSRSK
jgi:hypothetical protein